MNSQHHTQIGSKRDMTALAGHNQHFSPTPRSKKQSTNVKSFHLEFLQSLQVATKEVERGKEHNYATSWISIILV